ncbi:hypothetical protein [Acidiphilium sp.]|nr:hypothetical protein [Acidiphilium sp.]
MAGLRDAADRTETAGKAATGHLRLGRRGETKPCHQNGKCG